MLFLPSKFDKIANLCHKVVSIIDDFSLFWHSIILIWSCYLMRNQAEHLASFIPEHTTIPRHSMENSEPKSIVRYGLYLSSNWSFSCPLVVWPSVAISDGVDSKEIGCIKRIFIKLIVGWRDFEDYQYKKDNGEKMCLGKLHVSFCF